MPGIARLNDLGTGHGQLGCFPPRANTGASTTVFVNGLGIHRQGDAWGVHCCDDDCHSSVLASGSATVFVNGKQCGRIGDPIACGGTIATGSGNVFAGG